ncbi:hypothetical protein Rsub_12237 [Raphidocelis subcapitata]|uniref:Uncharacterized protein n=1 Tax=Raphidocelis subcapitata TaxID=307507 RepID=A0A2V0PQL0_9CHLO|nr:hypothetical protein Rsub_12237 [Raphidocelis subcapitata]|eukprot:GBF99797.1 hypothetical protein Rsub_12237 [Raphidocelis subcapitata]
MRRESISALPGLLALLLCAAAGRAAAAAGAPALARPAQDCLTPAVARVSEFNFFPEDYRSVIAAPRPPVEPGTTVTDAADFSIDYFGTYKVVTARRFNATYVLYQCGTPDPTKLPPGAAEGVPRGAASFEIPLYSVAVTDTTVNGFLSELGLVDRVALASPYSVGDCFLRLADSTDGCGLAVPDSYVDPSDAAAAARARGAEAAMANATDAVFRGFEGKGPKDILFPATADPGPLNRAEWVKYVAAFFNKEVQANALYAEIKDAYDRLKALAQSKRPPGPRPRVAWVSANASGVSFRLDAYKTALLEDAGGAPFDRAALEAAGAALSSDPTFGTAAAFLPLGGDGLAALLAQAAVVIDETYHPAPPAPGAVAASLGFASLPAAAAAVPAFGRGAVFRLEGEASPAGGSGWFEGAVARPDWVLADLVRAVNPETAAANSLASQSPAGEDFNFLTQVGAPGALGATRTTSAAACTAVPSCTRRAAAAICPNAYRDCATGKLRAADPEKRCATWSACELGAPAAGNSARAAGATAAAGAAVAAAAGAVLALV